MLADGNQMYYPVRAVITAGDDEVLLLQMGHVW